MKKLFLTSGLVLCMAGQAYGTDIDYTYSGNSGSYGSSACTYPYLETYDVDSSLEAMWSANVSGLITLDSNRYETSSSPSAAQTASPAAADASVYSVYNTAMYGDNPTTNTSQTAITGLTTDPQITGYTFSGFYTGKAGSGTQVIDANGDYLPAATTQIQAAGGTATWYAHWTANEYTISLNKNASHHGATDSNPTTLYTRYNEGAYLSAADRTASTNMMSTSANGLTTNAGGATYTLTLTPNLPGSHTVNDINSSTGYAASTSAQMQFNGFYSADTGGTPYIASTGKITQEGINAAKAVTNNSSVWYAQYQCSNASTYTPVLTGYTFNGWYTAATGGSVENNFCLTANKEVFAQWSPKTATITLDNKRFTSDSDAGTSTGITTAGTAQVVTRYENGVYANSTTAAAMTPTISSITPPVMTGYTFAGYWTTKYSTTSPATQYVAANGNLINNLDTWKNGESGNTTGTLYAHWTVNTHSITYNCGTKPGSESLTNGAQPPATQSNIAYGSTVSLSATPGTCEYKGWHFAGWKCSHTITTGETYSGSTANYAAALGTSGTYNGVYNVSATATNLTFNTDANVTCSAMWTANTIGLTWNPNGGVDQDGTSAYDPGTGTDSCIYDGSITLPAVPRRDGYTFQGWTVSNNP